MGPEILQGLGDEISVSPINLRKRDKDSDNYILGPVLLVDEIV